MAHAFLARFRYHLNLDLESWLVMKTLTLIRILSTFENESNPCTVTVTILQLGVFKQDFENVGQRYLPICHRYRVLRITVLTCLAYGPHTQRGGMAERWCVIEGNWSLKTNEIIVSRCNLVYRKQTTKLPLWKRQDLPYYIWLWSWIRQYLRLCSR